MGNEINQPWAIRARKIVDNAIHSINKDRTIPLRIVWGYADNDEADLAKYCPYQAGLLTNHSGDFEIQISKSGTQEYPDTIKITKAFPEAQVLLRSAAQLYNTLSCCQDFVTLDTMPEPEGPEILVTGVRAEIAVEQLSGRILNQVLHELSVSCGLAFDYLTLGEGHDSFSESGGIL